MSHNRWSQPLRTGLTLIEVLVVLVVIGVLVALAFPAIQMVRDGSRRTQCQNNLRQLGLATLNYESATGELPRGIYLPKGVASNKPIEIFSWGLKIADLVGGDSSAVDFSENQTVEAFLSTANPQDQQQLKTPAAWWRCPADPGTPELNNRRPGSDSVGNLCLSNYVASNNVGSCHGLRNAITRKAPNGAFHGIEAETMAGLEDGTSHTLMYSERIYGGFAVDDPPACAALQFGCRGAGNAALPAQPGMHDVGFSAAGGINRFRFASNPELVQHGVSSGHSGGVNAVLCDGSTHFYASNIDSYYSDLDSFERPASTADYRVWERLIAVNDGQVPTTQDIR